MQLFEKQVLRNQSFQTAEINKKTLQYPGRTDKDLV